MILHELPQTPEVEPIQLSKPIGCRYSTVNAVPVLPRGMFNARTPDVGDSYGASVNVEVPGVVTVGNCPGENQPAFALWKGLGCDTNW